MIFEHYRKWMNNLTRQDDGRISGPSIWHRMGTGEPAGTEKGPNYMGILVEAGGIEPPSEDLQILAATRLVRDLELASRTPADGLPEGQPIEVSGRRPTGELRRPSPLNDASARGHGRTAARRSRPLGREGVTVIVCG